MSAEGKTRKRMGITAIISSILIVATLVWGIYGFVLIQSGSVRQYDPHYEYDAIEYWPYTHDFAGSEGAWFDNLNYSDFNIDQPLPEDLFDMMNDPVFYVAPADPGQLWRIESYDQYDGSNWAKSSLDSIRDLDPGVEIIPESAATNQIYYVFFNASAGAEVGSMSIPSLFPSIMVSTASGIRRYQIPGSGNRWSAAVPMVRWLSTWKQVNIRLSSNIVSRWLKLIKFSSQTIWNSSRISK